MRIRASVSPTASAWAARRQRSSWPRNIEREVHMQLARSLLMLTFAFAAIAQDDRPDPHEIPVPRIKTPLGTLPGVDALPVRRELPDVLTMNDGTSVTIRAQWEKRRAEMRRILEYYAIGDMPPAPGNVKGKELKSETVLDGAVRYRL